MSFRGITIFLSISIVIIFLLAASESKSSKKKGKSPAVVESQDRVFSEAKKFAKSYRQCLLNRLNNKKKPMWERIPSAINYCLDKKFWKALKKGKIEEPPPGHHFKYVILPNSINSSCVAVKVGNNPDENFLAEKRLHQLLPNCKIYASADGHSNNMWSIGKYYPKVDAYQLSDQAVTHVQCPCGTIYQKGVELLQLRSFLEDSVGERHIDYLWIDHNLNFLTIGTGNSETNPNLCFDEYSIFTESIDVSICQIMIATEMFQESMDAYFMTNIRPLFEEIVIPVISESPFLPVYGKYSKNDGTLRQLYLNMFDPNCVNKFLAPGFFGGEK